MPIAWSQDEYICAYQFAAKAHANQWVPGTNDIPYICHVSLVSMEGIAAMQSDEGLDGDLVTRCSLLHDVIEDTAVTLGQVRAEFGGSVAAGVSALSKNSDLDKSLQMADSLRRIQQQSREIWLVKLADRIANLRPPPDHWDSERIARYREEARQILSVLGSASGFLADRLRAKIERYGMVT